MLAIAWRHGYQMVTGGVIEAKGGEGRKESCSFDTTNLQCNFLALCKPVSTMNYAVPNGKKKSAEADGFVFIGRCGAIWV